MVGGGGRWVVFTGESVGFVLPSDLVGQGVYLFAIVNIANTSMIDLNLQWDYSIQKISNHVIYWMEQMTN